MRSKFRDFVESLSVAMSIAALDVGARGGTKSDLAPIAPLVDYYLFEPDREQTELLKASASRQGWRSATVIDTALGKAKGTFELNLYRQRGCSSRLEADIEAAALFSRGDYYVNDGKVTVELAALDDLVRRGEVAPPAFIKLDVQGMENEVFEGAAEALANSIVGIRTEVCFFPMYHGQPLFAEIDQMLRPYGFVPMDWIEQHAWRRCTRAKYPARSSVAIPTSRGQLMHADVLYLLHPESLPADSDKDIHRLVALGLVALCYGFIDHAGAAFSHPRVREFVSEATHSDHTAVLQDVSRALARRASIERLAEQSEFFLKRLFFGRA